MLPDDSGLDSVQGDVSPSSHQNRALDEAIQRRLAEARMRLERVARVERPARGQFHRPAERPFTAEERDQVTLLFGGLTWKHERLIKAVFEGAGYRCETLSTPDVAAFQLGKAFGNAGQCNPAYFTVGSLLQYLARLQAGGLSRQEIVDRYVLFTVGCCGPCRFGMYESEYRLALENAGFDGFRVLLFDQNDGVKAASSEPGLKFTADFGVGMLNALNLGDALNDLIYRIRPYEVNRGETDRVFTEIVDDLSRVLRDREPFEILAWAPAWLSRRLATRRGLTNRLNTLGKLREHLYGTTYRDALRRCRERIDRIEVDRTRVKPLVKITGEFWAHMTEGDGNFNMFAFLEGEGAQLFGDPVGAWVMYLLHQAKTSARVRKPLDAPHDRPRRWELHKRLANGWWFRKKWLLLSIGERLWARQYHRVTSALGGLTLAPVPQEELARLARPFYHPLARGGEGHLEVGKNVYYTSHRLCHMVLSLKPFGCLPSTQSDGAQSAVVSRFPNMIFLPIETSGEGEVQAHSRVQMALGEAKARARTEFEAALASTGKRLEDIKAYVAGRPCLRRPFYRVPSRPGVAGVAANFILHVSDLMDGHARV